MSRFRPYDLALDSWRDVVTYYQPGDPIYYQYEDGGETCLANLINEWLWWGNGWARCFGEFEIFLKVVTFLVDEYYREGVDAIALYRFSGHPRRKGRVTSVFGDEAHMHTIFDRDNFNAAVFHGE
ncbi:hypothetical protein [Kibdelosporangium aridum]|uniref:Uncharacterized protein n=1 Tax=Kibdelosporangium aridum TaxID=2030 RepID=A0A1Y5XV36_KIBAR|nr:hypothetical protein [Kibdelosporangium aridum]SMD14661.1 hypothetical protein SAMN05661093_05090 [Kibdelosporangium aridum]